MSEQSSTPRASRWKTWALVASLAVNLLIVGLVVGAGLRGGPDRGHYKPSEGADFRSITQALPEKARGDLRKSVLGRDGTMRERRQRSADLRRDLILVLEAETFNPGALETLFTEQRTVLGDLAKDGHTLLLETISQMTPEERATFAENLRKGHKKKRR